jgi:hypothetical protein
VQANMATLPDVLPFYLEIAPAPNDARIAFAVVCSMAADDAELGVSVQLEDRAAGAEIFRFSRLAFVHIAWSVCGEVLAFGQCSTFEMVPESWTGS